MKFLWRKLKTIPLTVLFFLVGNVHMLFVFNFCITLYVHSQLCSHNVQNRYMTIILSYLLLCAVHLMQGFLWEKRLLGNYNCSQDRSFLTGNEENPALVLLMYTTEHQPEMVPCSALWAPPWIPPPWSHQLRTMNVRNWSKKSSC